MLADIDPGTALLSRSSVEACITERTRAVLLVHLYGQVREMDQWVRWCADHRLLLLEDCAQAHGATSNGRAAGSFGEWGAYSFYPTKNLGAIGDAGALVTRREDVASKARVLLNYGQSQRYHHPELGLNSRLDEVQAAILSVRLEMLSEYTLRRQQIAQTYFERITHPEIELMAQPMAVDSHVYHLFVIRSRQRDRLAEHLRAHGVESFIHYPVPIHRQPPCATMRTSATGLLHAEAHASECLSLPCNPQLSEAQLGQVIEVVNAFTG